MLDKEKNLINKFMEADQCRRAFECQQFYETLSDEGKHYFNHEAHKHIVLPYKRRKRK
jgi:hypothetical protein